MEKEEKKTCGQKLAKEKEKTRKPLGLNGFRGVVLIPTQSSPAASR